MYLLRREHHIRSDPVRYPAASTATSRRGHPLALLGNIEPVEDDEIAATAEIVQQSVRATVDQIMAILLKQASSRSPAEKPAAA